MTELDYAIVDVLLWMYTSAMWFGSLVTAFYILFHLLGEHVANDRR